jgi:hypothetical protein
VVGALALAAIVYGFFHAAWRLPPSMPPLDRATVSP